MKINDYEVPHEVLTHGRGRMDHPFTRAALANALAGALLRMDKALDTQRAGEIAYAVADALIEEDTQAGRLTTLGMGGVPMYQRPA